MDYATALRQGMPGTPSGPAIRGYFPDGSPIPDLSDMETFGSQGFVEGAKRLLKEEAPTMAGFLAGPAMGAAGRAIAAHPGMSAALLATIGLGAAEAGPKLTRRQQREVEMERQRLEAQANADKMRMEAETEAERQRAANAADIEARKAAQASERAEYDRQVGLAEAARDKELGRVRRFSDTGVGEAFESLGGLAPFLAGIAGGGLSRMATGPGSSMMGKVLKDYVLPVATGTAAGFTAANAPLAYDAFYTDPDNPEKAAYSAYARELPASHPRKQEFSDYAAGLPDKNPIREQASEEFYGDFGPRLGMSLIEGGGGALMGSDAVRAGARRLLGGGAGSGAAETRPHWARQTRNKGQFGPYPENVKARSGRKGR
jgi:hypothetical protein